ncbi:putative oxidoreductase [Acetobacter tropicalis NRIC 0312]|uniref:L-fucose dehydrogenase n=1 Tax=Acetobacter tropicalis TaxID=104102 RepID=A0A511FP19_9PROT|nr:aldo/keto reductase [Acetobacter tropicalis]KXV48556.1 L-fucose dehydrogenase [Acetobacter tropicalis]GAL96421.1 l-fucose dehydrogenase [Acetobacter tropicalis]GBR72079.1 putative oxidoreductase [Acetobacter tropicalis NRIC 0312]GEL50696.1 L-fucose dehydrogenase [Acetobacter tropicalis]
MTATRRTLLALSALGGAAALMPRSGQAQGTQNPGDVTPTMGRVTRNALPLNVAQTGQRFRPPTRLGLGGVPIGNGFAACSDEEAQAALAAAWEAGVRYFDTSPWYGLGLSERRFGHFLHTRPRDEFVLSTKVGRLLTAAPQPPAGTMWHDPSPFAYRYDYSADGVRRSVEDSLQRLGLSRIDIVYIHDLSPENKDMADRWTTYFDQAAKGAIPALTKMREEGLIKAWGLGVNTPQAVLRTIEIGDPDIVLLATQYSLFRHDEALAHTLPALAPRGISVVVGAPLNAGYAAGRDRYDYQATIPTGMARKRSAMQAIAKQHGVDLRTVALQFAAAHPGVAAVIPGARNAAQMQANARSMEVSIPPALWDDLKQKKLIAQAAPVPASS